CRDTKPDHAHKVIDRDIFRCDCSLWRNIVVVPEREARGRASVTVKLIRRRLASPAIKQAALHGNFLFLRGAEQARGRRPIKARNPIAHPHDRTTPNFRRTARRARFERENRQVGRQNSRLRELDGPDKTDFLRASEESNTMHVRSLFLQLSKHADNFRAAEQIVTSAGMNLTVANLKSWQIPHLEVAKGSLLGIAAKPRGDGTEEPQLPLLVADPAWMIHMRDRK